MARKTFTMEEIQEAIDAQEGLCVNCGAARDGVEPDAVMYECNECERCTVYGAEEILMMGLVK